MVTIRDAARSDLAGILQIRNHAILHSTATWTDEVESDRDCSRWLAERRAAGDAVIIADIESDNAVSIKLHRALGFTPAGTLPQIGRKFDRWLDLSIFTLTLG